MSLALTYLVTLALHALAGALAVAVFFVLSLPRSVRLAPLAFAGAALLVPVLALAQATGDVELVNGALDLVLGRWPDVAPYLALVPVIQVAAASLARLTKRTHSTWFNTALVRIASFPILRR